MGKIIKLTSIKDDDIIYLNFDCILLFAKYTDRSGDYTTIRIADGPCFCTVRVKETPEEIMKLISGEE